MVNDGMDTLKWCSVSLKEIQTKGNRLEASVYDVDAKKAWMRVKDCRYGSIPLMGENGIISNAFYPGRFKRIYVEQGGEPFYLPSQMCDIYPKTEKRISRLTKCDISKLRLEEDTLLLTRSGTIGNVSFVSETLKDKIFSDDVIRVKFKQEYDLGYAYAFLKSTTGSKVLQTNGYGSVITHLEPEHLKEIVIPNAPIDVRKRINLLVRRSYALRDKSNEYVVRATQMLIDELKMPSLSKMIQSDSNESYEVSLKNLNYRLDGSYHEPIIKQIVSHLETAAEEVTNLGDKRISKKIILAGIFKRTYVDEEHGYPFLGGKEMCQLAPKTEKYLSKVIHKARYEKELKVEKNTILVADRGTIGTTVMVPEHWNGYAVSQNVLKLIPATEDIAGYIYIYLNSDFGNKLVERQTYGSVVDMIDNNSLASVEIPLLKNKTVQGNINHLALKANELRYQAYCVEQEALYILNNEVLQ